MQYIVLILVNVLISAHVKILNMANICLLTDDAEFGLNLRKSVAAQKHTVRIVLDPHKFYTLDYSQTSLVLVGLFKTEFSGYFIEGLRERTELPILMVGEYTPIKAALALQAGADDYCGRQNSVELIARINKLLTRPPRTAETKIDLGKVVVNKDQCLVLSDDKQLDLRPKEYKILVLLAENMGRVLSRSRILDYISQSDALDTTVDVHISNLRKVLKKVGCENLIETVHGAGYKLKI